MNQNRMRTGPHAIMAITRTLFDFHAVMSLRIPTRGRIEQTCSGQFGRFPDIAHGRANLRRTDPIQILSIQLSGRQPVRRAMQPRDNVRHVERHGGTESVGMRTFPRCVLKRDRLDHSFGHAPQAQHECGQILVGSLEGFLLRLAEGLSLRLRLLAERPEGFRMILHEDETAQIVNQTGKEGIVGGAVAKSLSAQLAGEPSRKATVTPKQFDRHFREMHPLVTVEDVHREYQRFDVLGSQLEDGGL